MASKGQKAFFAAMDRGLSATDAIRTVERAQGKVEPRLDRPSLSAAEQRFYDRRNAAYNRDDN